MSSRRRAWVAALLSLLLAATCAAGWGAFVWFRTQDIPRGRVPAGQVWTSPQGWTVRLERLQVTSSLVDEDGRAHQPQPGTRFVVVDVQFHHLTPDATGCSLLLAGPGRMRWTTADEASLLPGVGWCTKEGAGPDPLVHTAFQVPESLVDDVQGVVLDHSMTLRQPPLFQRP